MPPSTKARSKPAKPNKSAKQETKKPISSDDMLLEAESVDIDTDLETTTDQAVSDQSKVLSGMSPHKDGKRKKLKPRGADAEIFTQKKSKRKRQKS